MRAFPEFTNESQQFWSLVRFVSESLGYTVRNEHKVRSCTAEEIRVALKKQQIRASDDDIERVANYLQKRADLLNNVVSKLLMDVDEARSIFEDLHEIYVKEGFTSKLPMNKQSNSMKQINYFFIFIACKFI